MEKAKITILSGASAGDVGAKHARPLPARLPVGRKSSEPSGRRLQSDAVAVDRGRDLGLEVIHRRGRVDRLELAWVTA